MNVNRLQLNADKTEVLWRTTGRRQHQFPSGTLTIDGTAVSASSSVRDLGIHIDADLLMRTHVQKTVALLRRPPSARSNPSLSATAYVPVAYSHSGELAARQRQRRLDRPPGS